MTGSRLDCLMEVPMMQRFKLPVEVVNGKLVYIKDPEQSDEPYEITPGDEEQTFMFSVVVNPIPSNYGKITWDGTVITVS